MNKIKRQLKDILRPAKYTVNSAIGYLYDYIRLIRHAGWVSVETPSKRDYKSSKIYHRLEKSLSFPNRRKNSGKDAVDDLSYFLEKHKTSEGYPTFHERIANNVLQQFLTQNAPECSVPNKEATLDMATELKLSELGGIYNIDSLSMINGTLEDPEGFFNTRYSVRDFSSREVSVETVLRAIKMALKTPSVCNRQAWHAYIIDDADTIREALSHQNGNKGFGQKIPFLLILSSDLHAFDMPEERYQHWIDGGMFSMSVVLALHSLGLSSCCLNWSKSPLSDIAFRKKFKIKKSHTILMMLAVGYAAENLKVCQSQRKSLDSYYTALKK
ncbi:nitroreductase family protein [Pseudomonas citronellolis]|uniref:nitroreductase family protein n=1 Tax=Pseudomonas TaxID=286 RepID=UPI000E2F9383|nr:nitroreductase family protein [Pseudomonas citronellolis]MCP1602159.1 nitroreductase [Pseudomonas citronellolis]MCP1653118.1 nitroreductase [Pseudomonas citronellolis]MCP1720063.1 nitroreductase [Pseudomonas citronellolis]